MDSWSQKLLERYPGFSSPELLHVLEAHAELWKAGHAYMEWDELGQLASESQMFSDGVAKAREMYQKGERLKVDLQSVSTNTQVGLFLDRSYIVISEREMRRHAELSRIKTSSLAKLPSLEVPHEDCSGEMETVFVFADPSQPFRKAMVRVGCSNDRQQVMLAAGQSLTQSSQPSTTPMPVKSTQSERRRLTWCRRTCKGT